MNGFVRRRTGMFVTALAILLVSVAAGCKSGAPIVRATADFPAGRGFSMRSVYFERELRRFMVFVPRDYDPRKKYPAIVFLHGLFEAGDDADKPLAAGLGPEIARDPDRWPFVVIFPQSKGTWRGDANDRLVMTCLAEAKEQFSIDADRVLLAGLSYGGLGTWQIGARHTDTFAALVPMGGHADLASAPPIAAARTPVWVFHYSGDLVVPVGGARRMVEELRARGHDNVRYTEFPTAGHNPWDQAVAETDVVQWMLQQRRVAK